MIVVNRGWRTYASAIEEILEPVELAAIRQLVRIVIVDVHARLVQAALFGSRARGEARRDSDLDVLLIFRKLPEGREPQASQADRIAERIAADSRVPVTVWCVSLMDLAMGRRTPMLIDALEDSIPIWCDEYPITPVPFTPADALFCGERLLARVAEGSEEFTSACVYARWEAAAARARDDIVRLCTAWLLLNGDTRPRRAVAVRAFVESAYGSGSPPREVREALRWAEESFGPEGRDEMSRVSIPPGGLPTIGFTIDHLSALVRGKAHRVRSRQGAPDLHHLEARIDNVVRGRGSRWIDRLDTRA